MQLEKDRRDSGSNQAGDEASTILTVQIKKWEELKRYGVHVIRLWAELMNGRGCLGSILGTEQNTYARERDSFDYTNFTSLS